MRGILNRRSQPGRYPLHRSGLGYDLIDVIAIDALKRAHLFNFAHFRKVSELGHRASTTPPSPIMLGGVGLGPDSAISGD